MAAYKKDQGRYARMLAYWALLLVIFAGLYKLRFWLDNLAGWLKKPLLGGNLPVLGVPLTISVILSWAVLPVVCAVGLHRLLNRPKTADLLIETEGELKKCTWPTLLETWNASVIVVITVVVIGLFLAGADFVLKYVFDLFIFSGQ